MPGTGIRHTAIPFAPYGTLRRDDTPLPDDEARWPDTPAVRAAIDAEYDGDPGVARDIGLRLGGYPSRRIQDIAVAMGIHADRLRELMLHGAKPRWRKPDEPPSPLPSLPTPTPVEPVEKEDTQPVSQFATLPERSPDQPEPDEADETPTPAPDATPAPAPAMLTCRDCKQPFAPWKPARSGVLCRTATCRDCFRAQMSATARRIGTKPPPYGSRGNPRKPAAPLAAEKWEAKPAPEPPQDTTDGELVTALRDGYHVEWTDAPMKINKPLTDYGVNPSALELLLPKPAPSPRRALRASLHTLIDLLPDGDTWSDSEHERRWKDAFDSLLDLIIERKSDARMWRAGGSQ